MKYKILSLNAGYSLCSLLQNNPNLNAQFGLLGMDCRQEIAVTDSNQFIDQISRSVKDNRLILILDNAPELRAREILAQGFHKPLYRPQGVSGQIPQDAVVMAEQGLAQPGFVMLYATCCIALIPGTGSAAVRMIVNQLYPLLLRQLYPGAVMVDVPMREEQAQTAAEYLERIKKRNPDFLPMLGGTRESPVLRLIAVKETEKQSRSCCDSFLEDMVTECGNLTTVSGVGMRGTRAVQKRQQKEESTLDFTGKYASSAYSLSGSASSDGYLLEQDVFLDDEDEDDSDYEEDNIVSSKSRRQRKAERKIEKQSRKAQNVSDGEAAAERRSPIISFLLVVFILIFIGSVGYLGYYYWKSAQNRTAYESLKDVYNQTTLIAPPGYPSGYDKDFAALWQINPDTVGWLSIDGTDLDYPVVQTTDNTKYYRTNFEGEYSEHAVPFVDTQVDLKKPSDNIIIYGHNIRTDGQMFNILKGYTELEFYQQHPVVEFDSVYHKGKYKIVSVFYANTLEQHGGVFPYHEFINAQSAEEKQAFIDDILIRSIINTGVDIQPSDELLTLSTCSYEFKDARYVVVARKVRKGESAEVDTSKAQMNPTPLYPDVWYQLFGGTKPDKTQLKANLPH